MEQESTDCLHVPHTPGGLANKEIHKGVKQTHLWRTQPFLCKSNTCLILTLRIRLIDSVGSEI